MTKQNYLETENAKRFAAIAASLDFEVACDTTLLHFVATTPETPDHNQAIARAYALDGAKRFLRILQNIATPEEPAKTERWPEMVKT